MISNPIMFIYIQGQNVQRPTGTTVAAWGRLFGSRLTLQKGVDPSVMSSTANIASPAGE